MMSKEDGKEEHDLKSAFKEEDNHSLHEEEADKLNLKKKKVE